MATTPKPSWNFDHDPSEVPLGCNGKPRESGLNAHKRKGEPVCDKCKYASNHTRRERKRGQRFPRRVDPCGTRNAAQRHRARGEKMDFPCKVAEAEYNAANTDKNARNKLFELKRYIEVGTSPEEFIVLASILTGAKK